jgi:hypothetical protein
MRKFLLFLLLICLSAPSLRAQTGAGWAPGARWSYFSAVWLGGYGDLRLEYVGDTTITGRLCQKLQRRAQWSRIPDYPLPPLYTAADADAVWLYADGQFLKLYDFSARPGDSWLAPVTIGGERWCQPVQVTVDSVGQQLFAGRVRRWFRVRYQATTLPGTPVRINSWGRVYEGLGPVSHFMTITSPCNLSETLTVGELLCYGTGGQNQYTSPRYPNCTAVVTAATPAATKPVLGVWPNPSAGLLTL